MTGSMLLLNVLSLLALFLMTRWLLQPERLMAKVGETGQKSLNSGGKTVLSVLLFGVIAVNCLAVYGNGELRKSTDTLVSWLIDEDGASIPAPVIPKKAPEAQDAGESNFAFSANAKP